MDDHEISSLHDRVAALEDIVRKLQSSTEQLVSQLKRLESDASAAAQQPVEPPRTYVQQKVDTVQPTSAEPPGTFVKKQGDPVPPAAPKLGPIKPDRPRPAKKSFEMPEHMRKSEYWLNKVGIGLILFAVVFLFKYSIDQGWLTPPIRVLFGLALGTALLAIGYRIYGRKKQFSQVLTGGAIATYYITGFAAFQLFSLVSYPVALGFMIGVTVLSFLISLRQDEAVFSLIGTLGGLGTPFLLYTEGGTVPGLMLYTCLILAGTSAIYFYQGWRLLLWLSVVGGWIIIIIGIADINISFESVNSEQWALQAGVLAGWILFWLVPLFREIVWVTNPGRWRGATVGIGDGALSKSANSLLDVHIYVLAIVVPLISLALSGIIWPDLSKEVWGWIVLGGASVYALTGFFLKRIADLKNLVFTHVMMSLLFFTIALSLLLEGDTLFIAVATEAAVLHMVALRISNRGVSVFAHILFGICGLALMNRLSLTEISQLMQPATASPIINARALTDLWVIGLGVLMSFRLRSIVEKRVYLIPVFIFIGAWFARELEGNFEFVVMLALSVAVHFVAKWKKDRIIAGLGHVFFGVIAILLIYRLLKPDTDATAILNIHALVSLLPLIVSAGIYKWFKAGKEIIVYRLLAHTAFLAWFASEFSSMENGQGYITISWGVYAALLLIAGLQFNYHRLRTVAIVTLFVVVAKLFLIDLAKLEVLWRILLFMGFGGLFLFLSYYFQDLWKGTSETEDSED